MFTVLGTRLLPLVLSFEKGHCFYDGGCVEEEEEEGGEEGYWCSW